MTPSTNMLLVERYENDARHIMELGHSEKRTPYHFSHVGLLADALAFLRKSNTQLVLLNLNLSDSQGVDTLRTLIAEYPLIPVVILSESEDKATCTKTMQLGAQDYLVKKNITYDVLSRVIRYAIATCFDRESLEKHKQHVLQASIDALSAITAAVDHRGKILAVNGALREFLFDNKAGFNEVDAHSDYLQLFDHIFYKNPEDAASFAAGVQSVIGGIQDIFEMEYACTTSVRELWFHCRAVAVPGAEQRVILTHEDITGRKQAEESSVISEKRLRVLIDTSPNCIFVTDHHGHYILVNSALASLYGISKSEIVGKNNAELPCNYLTEIKKPIVYMDQGDNGGRDLPVSINSVFTLPNGQVRWFSTIKKPIVFPGATDCTVNIAMDVTSQCKAQDALLNAELRMRTILDAQSSRVTLLDSKRRILWPNTKACEDAGLSRSEIIGHHCQKIWGVFSPPCEVCPVAQAMEDGKPHSEQKRTTDGKTFRVHGFPVKDDMGRIVSAVEVVEEITERITLENQLRQAQKMESLGTLAGGIAHDFNNILSGILGYTELAMEKSKETPAITNYLNAVYQAGLRATELTRQILTFSRRTDTKLSPLRVGPIMGEALKLLRSTLPTSIEIEVHIEKDLQQILADATQIHQIIMNLCTNASHAMEPKGGTLGVRLTQVELRHGTVTTPNGLERGQYLQLSISDTGTGMSPEIVGMIFDPYFTTKDLGVGTGLGLSVIHGIVNEYGGAISVDSIPGEGSTFNLFFPTVQVASQVKEQFNLKSLPKGTEKILVVDDEPTILKLSKRILKGLGYLVTTVNDSISALELFKKDPGAFDLVFSDVTMPKLTGDQLAIEILAIRPDIPVILCTGYSRMVSEESVKAIGVDALLTKPVVKKQLATEIRRALDERKKQKEDE